jgi:hypothetical protein
VSPNTTFLPGKDPENAITQAILANPRVVYEVTGDRFVVAIRDELLVRQSVADTSTALTAALKRIARPSGAVGGRVGNDRPTVAAAAVPAAQTGEHPSDVQLWHITDSALNSIDVARKLRALAPKHCDAPYNTAELTEPAVSPNHVAVLCSKNDSCPASPPEPSPPPRDGGEFILAAGADRTPRVVIIDSGYFAGVHPRLDGRVDPVLGEWLDSTTGTWHADLPDEKDANGDGILDGIAGHGTFNAGLVASLCPEVVIKVVASRHDIQPLGDLDPVDQEALFSSEFDIANAVWVNSEPGVDVISCGFAFPTLDDYPSIPFNAVMAALRGPESPNRELVVVSPAGNESATQPYWPGALPGVLGVAATNRLDNGRAAFSNWGKWCDCCVRGDYVLSTYIDWDGPVQGLPPAERELFTGWARWDGTSFAAPKVAAAIASVVAASGRALSAIEAWERIAAGATKIRVGYVTDTTLFPVPGVQLLQLVI